MKTIVLVVSVALTCSLLPGCKTVEPWEKAQFGDYIMRADRDPLADSFAEHIHFTREAAAGGRGVGGGGCGCN